MILFLHRGVYPLHPPSALVVLLKTGRGAADDDVMDFSRYFSKDFFALVIMSGRIGGPSVKGLCSPLLIVWRQQNVGFVTAFS